MALCIIGMTPLRIRVTLCRMRVTPFPRVLRPPIPLATTINFRT